VVVALVAFWAYVAEKLGVSDEGAGHLVLLVGVVPVGVPALGDGCPDYAVPGAEVGAVPERDGVVVEWCVGWRVIRGHVDEQ